MILSVLLIITTAVMAIEAEVNCYKPPLHVNINNCCEVSELISDKIKEKCETQMSEANDFGPPRDHHHGPPDRHHRPFGIRGGPHKFGPPHHCFLSCVVNETGILVDGELQVDNLNSYLNKLFGDAEKVEFVSKQFRSCDDKGKDFNKKLPKRSNGPFHCASNQNGMIMGCVHMETFKNCPDSLWSNTDECNEVRDHFNQCWHFTEKSDAENSDVNMEEVDEI